MTKLESLKLIENTFKIPFEKVINDLHINEGISILRIAKQAKVTRFIIYNLCKDFNLKTNSCAESAIHKYKFFKHWADGTNKANSKAARMASERMKSNNPSKNKKYSHKRALTMEQIFVKKILPQELIFKNILDNNSVKFVMQKAIGPYNVDFLVGKLVIEIDSTDKWGVERRMSALKKDTYLRSLGYKVLRINKRHLGDMVHTINVLKTNNVI